MVQTIASAQGGQPSVLHSSHFCWMLTAWMGACKHMSSTMLAQYSDSLMLENSAALLQKLGAPGQTFQVNESSLSNFIITTGFNPQYAFFLEQNIPNAICPTTILSEVLGYGMIHYRWPSVVNGQPLPVYIQGLLQNNPMSTVVSKLESLINSSPNATPNSFSNAVEATAKANNLSAPPMYTECAQVAPGTLTGAYTINFLLLVESYYANQGNKAGTANANCLQSLIGQLQAELSERIQIGQQYVTQETNLATSTDPQSSNVAMKELSDLNTARAQWVELTGSPIV